MTPAITSTVRRTHTPWFSREAWMWQVTGPWGSTGAAGWSRLRVCAAIAARRARHDLEASS